MIKYERLSGHALDGNSPINSDCRCSLRRATITSENLKLHNGITRVGFADSPVTNMLLFWALKNKIKKTIFIKINNDSVNEFNLDIHIWPFWSVFGGLVYSQFGLFGRTNCVEGKMRFCAVDPGYEITNCDQRGDILVGNREIVFTFSKYFYTAVFLTS